MLMGLIRKGLSSLILLAILSFAYISQTWAFDLGGDYQWADSNSRFELVDGFTIGGSFRTRYESKYDFKFDDATPGNDDARTLTQLRLNAKWVPTDWLTLFAEGQDARVFGENATTDKNAVPSPVWIHDPWDLHQAFFDLNFLDLDIPLTIRTGRQKINFGSQRLVGALEWVNTARVWDGVKATVGTKGERTLVGFAAKQITVDPNNPNDWADLGRARYQDSDLYGVYYTEWELMDEVQLELYWLYRDNDDTSALGSASSGGDEVHSFGTRFETKQNAWDFNGEFVGQIGDFGGLDHQAFAAHIEGGYTAESLNNTRFSVGYNFASGDDDSTDGDHETFDNLFPTNHKFYGAMDFFAWQNIHNLVLKAHTKVFDKIKVGVDYHAFWLVEEDADSLYGAGRGASRTATGDVDDYVGSEIDVTLKFWVVPKRLNVILGYSHFWAGDYIDDTGTSGVGNDADFFYAQSKITF